MGAFIRRRGGRITVAAAILSTLVAIVIGLRSTQRAQATSDGDPYSVPLAVDTNSDPNIFETTIVAESKTVNIGNGVTANVLTYNGTVPGPTITGSWPRSVALPRDSGASRTCT